MEYWKEFDNFEEKLLNCISYNYSYNWEEWKLERLEEQT